MKIRGCMVVGLLVLMAAVCVADNGWGPTASYWDAGRWGDDVSPGLRIALELRPGLMLDLRYTSLSSQHGSISGVQTCLDDDIVDVGIVAVRPTRRCYIYAGGGASYHMLDVRTERTGEDDLYDDSWGVYGVMGADGIICGRIPSINAERVSVFAEATYRYASLGESSTGARLPGAPDNMDGFGLGAGLLLRW